MACGQDERAEQAIAHIQLGPTENPLVFGLISLARLHIDSEGARRRAALDEAALERIAAHLPLVARMQADILAKISPQQERWRTLLQGLRRDNVIAFTDIIGFKPKWERALDRLTEFLTPAAPGTSSSQVNEVSKRLAFLLDPRTCEVEALEQVKKGGTWTPGRPVAMKRLSTQDPKLDYLTAADRRVLQTIRKEMDEEWYGSVVYAFDAYKSVLALIGHPHIFDARERGRHIELVAYPAELVVSEARQGYLFTLSHPSDVPTVFIEEERLRGGG